MSDLLVKNVLNATEIKSVLVIAAFREFDNLSILLSDLDKRIPKSFSIIICDDTGRDFQQIIEEIVRKALSSQRQWILSFSDSKSGRGSAVVRGFKLAMSHFSNLEFLAECDSDGSHQPADIEKILLHKPCDFLIGSRYLSESKIEGWPKSRRIASRILNYLIPKALGLEVTDVTNGLRRYSTKATSLIINHPQENTGFIFLSEQALLLHQNGIRAQELPITFVDRIHGESSVGAKEIVSSLKGVFTLYVNHRKH